MFAYFTFAYQTVSGLETMICYEAVIAYGVMTSYVNIIGDKTIRTR